MVKEFILYDAVYGEQAEQKRIPIKKSIKDDIIRNQKGKCALCGLTFLEKGIYPPDFHHIDGNPKHNKSENIEAICPNCHRKETYKQWLDKAKSTKRTRSLSYNQIGRA